MEVERSFMSNDTQPYNTDVIERNKIRNYSPEMTIFVSR